MSSNDRSVLVRRGLDEDNVHALGRQIGAAAAAPILIGLSGSLGAGKTRLVRGLMEGVDPALRDWVSSPTYAVCNEYPSVPPVRHFDLYRLSNDDDLEGVAFWDLIEDAICLIEWPERVNAAAEELDLLLRIEVESPTIRTVGLYPQTSRGAKLVDALR